MIIGIPNEAPEPRVAATPTTVAALLRLGYDVAVESGAGSRAAFPDQAYIDAGARIVDADQAWSADVVALVTEPPAGRITEMRPGQYLIGSLHPRTDLELTEALARRGVTALSMDMVPRISRAQSLDVLSSMANIAGYRAVIEASHEFGRFFGGQVTAAGKVPPARVLVIGTGVAGLAAIGAARNMGAEVFATDVRPETAEQVESMGATFWKVGDDDQGVSSDGYAKDASADYAAKAAELYAREAPNLDVIITTAAIPGRPSPRLLTTEMVDSMRPGSVVVDLAAAGGGNVASTRPGQTYTTESGVTIVGALDLPSRMPAQASQLYGSNVVNLLKLLTPAKDGELVVNFDDEVDRQMTVATGGEVTFPPPAIQVSVAPTSAKKAVVAAAPEAPKPIDQWSRFRMLMLVVAGWLALTIVLPMSLLASALVFGLACVVGYYIIWGVQPALYTPLMSVSNAISGITIVGAITQLTSDVWYVQAMAFIALVLAGINCVGGFAITHRMLGMFRRS